jgi:hypothetical protein
MFPLRCTKKLLDRMHLDPEPIHRQRRQSSATGLRICSTSANVVARTANRSVLGMMNDFALGLSYRGDDESLTRVALWQAAFAESLH